MNRRNKAKELKAGFPVFILAVSLLLSLVMITPGTALASSAPSSTADELTVTSYQVNNGANTAVFTGKITKGTRISLIINITDTRSGGVAPVATGNTTSFTPNNIASTSSTSNPVSGSGNDWTIIFTNLTYTGVGQSFTCVISYPGTTIPAASITIPLNQCVEYTGSPPPDPGDGPTPVDTDFVLKSASYGDDAVYAGQVFTLSAVILTTSGGSSVDNVTVSFVPPEQMTIVEGTSVVYVGRMAPNTSTSVSTALMPNGNIQEGSYNVGILVEGFNNGRLVSRQMSISIPVLQPERFEIFNTMLPTFLNAGMNDGMGFGSITLVNKGQGAVSNVTVNVEGDGLYFADGRQFIGNVAGGAQSNADFNMMADIPGWIEGTIIVDYENVRGQHKQLEYLFSVEVAEPLPPGFEEPGMVFPEEPPQPTGLPNWAWILIIAAAAVAATVFLVRRRKKKLAAAEAALDADEDDDD